MEMEIDGVGGVSILAKAKVFRSGVHFPAFSFEKHAETEGFGKVNYVSRHMLKTSTNLIQDGQADEILSCWFTALYCMALI